MLIDPFLVTDPPYSEQCSGVRELQPGTAIDWLKQIKACFELAGWTQTGRVPSNLTQEIWPVLMGFTTPPIPPVVPGVIADPCEGSTWGYLGTLRQGTHTTYFMPYDPYRYLAPDNSLCDARVWFPLGLTYRDTAENLAIAMTDNSPFDVVVRQDSPTDNFHFDYTAKGEVAWEYDESYPMIGWGESQPDGGSYTYKSRTLNGCYLTVKLMDSMTLCFRPGGTISMQVPASIGELQPWLHIKSSGSLLDKQWESVFWVPTHCWFHGNPYQFVIWTDEEGRFKSSILASMPFMDTPHFTKANPVLIVASENYDMHVDYQQLMTKLHWEDSVGSGFDSQLHFTTLENRSSAGPNPDNHFRTPMAIFRGLRDAPLLTLSETALTQPAYVMVSEDPTGQPSGEQQDWIAGRLWDMVVLTDTVLNVDSHSVMSGKHWQVISTSARPYDLRGSLWVTHDSVGVDV